MTEEQIALARRAVACKGWRWMLGMQAITPDGLFGHRVTEHTVFIDPDHLPDLTDPATLGCLLALVREAFGSMTVFALWSADRQTWIMRHGRTLVRAETEAETLVAALEAAP